MHLIKLSATDSTNAHMKRLLAQQPLPDGTVLWAEEQTHGRGQPGTSWNSEGGKNLTFSVLKQIKRLQARDHFLINILVSRSILGVLRDCGIPGLSVKWPNDILSGRRKLCGILPENQLQGSQISRSIIGIGLNVNQLDFGDLPRAGSMRQASDRYYDLGELLSALHTALQTTFGAAGAWDFEAQRARYEPLLFMKDQTATFSRDGGMFPGIIRGISREGKLKVETESEGLQAYGFKEIAMHY